MYFHVCSSNFSNMLGKVSEKRVPVYSDYSVQCTRVHHTRQRSVLSVATREDSPPSAVRDCPSCSNTPYTPNITNAFAFARSASTVCLCLFCTSNFAAASFCNCERCVFTAAASFYNCERCVFTAVGSASKSMSCVCMCLFSCTLYLCEMCV